MQRYDGNEPGSSALRTGSSPRSIGGGGATASAPPPNRIKRAYSGIGNRYSVSRNPTTGWPGFGCSREPGAADEYAASTRRPSPGRVLAKPGSPHCTTRAGHCGARMPAPTDSPPICPAAFECGSIAGGWGRTRRRERGYPLAPSLPLSRGPSLSPQSSRLRVCG